MRFTRYIVIGRNKPNFLQLFNNGTVASSLSCFVPSCIAVKVADYQGVLIVILVPLMEGMIIFGGVGAVKTGMT